MSHLSPFVVILPDGIQTGIGAEYFLVCKLCKRAYFETFADLYRHQSFHHKVITFTDIPAMQGPPRRAPGIRAAIFFKKQDWIFVFRQKKTAKPNIAKKKAILIFFFSGNKEQHQILPLPLKKNNIQEEMSGEQLVESHNTKMNSVVDTLYERVRNREIKHLSHSKMDVARVLNTSLSQRLPRMTNRILQSNCDSLCKSISFQCNDLMESLVQTQGQAAVGNVDVHTVKSAIRLVFSRAFKPSDFNSPQEIARAKECHQAFLDSIFQYMDIAVEDFQRQMTQQRGNNPSTSQTRTDQLQHPNIPVVDFYRYRGYVPIENFEMPLDTPLEGDLEHDPDDETDWSNYTRDNILKKNQFVADDSDDDKDDMDDEDEGDEDDDDMDDGTKSNKRANKTEYDEEEELSDPDAYGSDPEKDEEEDEYLDDEEEEDEVDDDEEFELDGEDDEEDYRPSGTAKKNSINKKKPTSSSSSQHAGGGQHSTSKSSSLSSLNKTDLKEKKQRSRRQDKHASSSSSYSSSSSAQSRSKPRQHSTTTKPSSSSTNRPTSLLLSQQQPFPSPAFAMPMNMNMNMGMMGVSPMGMMNPNPMATMNRQTPMGRGGGMPAMNGQGTATSTMNFNPAMTPSPAPVPTHMMQMNPQHASMGMMGPPMPMSVSSFQTQTTHPPLSMNDPRMIGLKMKK